MYCIAAKPTYAPDNSSHGAQVFTDKQIYQTSLLKIISRKTLGDSPSLTELLKSDQLGVVSSLLAYVRQIKYVTYLPGTLTYSLIVSHSA